MRTKRIIVSGATGYVGRFIVEGLLSSGCQVLVLGRNKPPDYVFSQPMPFEPMLLSQTEYKPSIFQNYDGLIHTAFHHIQGKYRGGEGNDPAQFEHYNHHGSMALFEAAKAAGIPRIVFLSSRAVYGAQEEGNVLFETTEPNPDTLYGEVKLKTERALVELSSEMFLPIILRATGVYGPTKPPFHHKWYALFNEFNARKAIAPRVGTEVHGDDLSQAVNLLLSKPTETLKQAADGERTPIFNISDILLDRSELLKTYAELTNQNGSTLHQRANASGYNVMDCMRLKSIGWQPRGYLDLSWLV